MVWGGGARGTGHGARATEGAPLRSWRVLSSSAVFVRSSQPGPAPGPLPLPEVLVLPVPSPSRLARTQVPVSLAKAALCRPASGFKYGGTDGVSLIRSDHVTADRRGGKEFLPPTLDCL